MVWFGNIRNRGFSLDELRPIVLALRWLPSPCDIDCKSLVTQCLEICSALKDKGCKFSLSLRLGSSFNFSLSSEGCSPEATQRTRRSPSYLRRQTLRRAAFLERKKKPPLANEAASTRRDNKDCRQGGVDLLEKKTASSR